jgi:hypothetical protein
MAEYIIDHIDPIRNILKKLHKLQAGPVDIMSRGMSDGVC